MIQERIVQISKNQEIQNIDPFYGTGGGERLAPEYFLSLKKIQTIVNAPMVFDEYPSNPTGNPKKDHLVIFMHHKFFLKGTLPAGNFL